MNIHEKITSVIGSVQKPNALKVHQRWKFYIIVILLKWSSVKTHSAPIIISLAIVESGVKNKMKPPASL
jgi:hypothetical protein